MKAFPRASGWRRILMATTTAGAAVTVVAAVLGAVVSSGTPALLSGERSYWRSPGPA